MKANKRWWSLPAGVWILGGVSLLNDMATESIYPLLPFFLTTVLGAGAVSLGIIEGAAEAISSVLKIISGRLSDRWQRRKPIVVAGYGLSALARPFISLAGSWGVVFLLRFIDRIGKGVRGAPRDAMLADLADETNRGRVYGFHRWITWARFSALSSRRRFSSRIRAAIARCLRSPRFPACSQ